MSLTGLHPEFSNKILKLLNLALSEKLNVGVQQGFRSFEEQNALYAEGRTKPGKTVTDAPGGLSWHNFGIAADLVFKDDKGNWSWDEKWPWTHLGVLGKSLGLEWGGDWPKIGKRSDRPHFQFTNGLSIREALRTYQQSGLAGVWLKVYP